MFFDIREEMQHEGECEFIEENDAQHGQHSNRFCALLHYGGFRVVRISFYFL